MIYVTKRKPDETIAGLLAMFHPLFIAFFRDGKYILNLPLSSLVIGDTTIFLPWSLSGSGSSLRVPSSKLVACLLAIPNVVMRLRPRNADPGVNVLPLLDESNLSRLKFSPVEENHSTIRFAI